MYGGCRQYFTFLATKEGKTIISFIYKRSWETEPYEKKNIVVIIKY